ncbi:MAG: galactose-1-phosphate uridylyltransferase [Nitrospirae bacterium]|nr:galactose-1-phosphate uridylyltransferase [Nitrospirota bacterium]
MSELRLNLITREWVIISTERTRKPKDFIQKRDKKIFPEFVDTCPFCPGNEHKTPPEIMRIQHNNKWLIRVIPNKFAVLSHEGEKFRTNEGLKHLVNGVGRHEVIIETPVHNTMIALMSVGDISNVLRVYKERFIELSNNPSVEHVIIFKNQGIASGTSMVHPHSQIIGTPVTPLQVRDRISEVRRHFDLTGECLMCVSLKDELNDGRRIILNSNHFVTFIPYAALSPFHIWIFPKRHQSAFGHLHEEEIADLACNLKTILSKLYFGLNNPDYNLVIRSEIIKNSGNEYFHWYISIVPRLVQASGFELGSGIYYNAAVPEEVAEFMRNVKT